MRPDFESRPNSLANGAAVVYTAMVVIRIQKYLRGYSFRIRKVRGKRSAERHVICHFIHGQVKYVTLEQHAVQTY